MSCVPGYSWVMSVALIGSILVSAAGATAEEPVTLLTEYPRDAPGSLQTGWRFHPGDDPQYATSGFDDSDWTPVSGEYGVPLPKGASVGWFRRTIRLPPEAVGRPVGLWVQHLGPVEIFADGQRVLSIGDVDTALAGENYRLSFQPELHYVVARKADSVWAVRFAAPRRDSIERIGFQIYFNVAFGAPQDAVKKHSEAISNEHRLFFFFMGEAFSLAFLHLLLFVFLPSLRQNFYYAMMTFSVAMLTGCVLGRSYADTHAGFMWAHTGFAISILLLSGFGLKFFYALLNRPFSRMLKGSMLVGVGLMFTAWMLPIWVIYIYATFGLIEQFRLSLLAHLRQLRDTWIITLGVAIMTLVALFQMLPEVFGKHPPVRNAYIYGFSVMLLTMAIYLARTFARTHKELSYKLVEVQQLSETTLEQERRAKSEELRRILLEEENKLQAVELDAAKARQRVLEQLEATNQELRDTQAQLVQSEKMAALGQLVAGIAHEINTPIGAICSMHDSLGKATHKLRGRIDTMAPELADDKKTQATLKIIDDANRVIESGSERVATIVKRLKTFARLDEAELQVADLHEGLDDTLVLLRHELKLNITVVKNYGEIPKISCYPGQLNQVFLNLLVNARQAIDGRGEIQVSTRLEGDEVHVAIRDTGSGIAPGNLKRIFDPGFTTKGVKVGTGLGLAICYRIVQAHKGEIRVDSNVGEGTTFEVVLPTNLDVIGTSRSGSV